ncbi:MAG: LytR/AlgR family response regulator transcription factor [Bernardetiaceae bacterium]
MDKILIVEDNKLTYNNLAAELEDAGYQVMDYTPTGELALERLEENPDLVVLDIQLAGKLNGIAVARAIGERFSIPFIYLSSYTEKMNQAKSTAPFAFLPKPVSGEELEQKIRELLLACKQLRGKDKREVADTASVFFPKRNEKVRIRLSDIQFVEAESHHVLLHTDQQRHAISQTLQELLDHISGSVPNHGLLRVHRSYLVNISRIASVKGSTRNYTLLVEGCPKEIPVGRSYEAQMLIVMGLK